MRRKAGERPVLTSSAGAPDRAGRDHVATVGRGEATVARLWWQRADDNDLAGWIAAELPQGQTAVLEHRRVPVQTANRPTQKAAAGGRSSGEVSVRLVSVDDQQVLARASARCVDRLEHWTLQLAEGRVWELQVPLWRRFGRLEVREAGRATSWRVEQCRRPSGWALTGPSELGAASTVMCLWLVHLLDVGRVLRDRPWWAPLEWTVLADTTGRLAPGGFTAVYNSGGGGTAPSGGF